MLKIKSVALRNLFKQELLNKNGVVKYSEWDILKRLLIMEPENSGYIDIDGESRKYKPKKNISLNPVIYFWVEKSTGKIVYVGKAGKGLEKRLTEHEGGWKDENNKAQKNIPIENQRLIIWTIPVHQLPITDEELLRGLSPFERNIEEISVDIIDQIEKIFIFICQPLLNTHHKNGNSVDIAMLENILGINGE